jgi:hypothetical protein
VSHGVHRLPLVAAGIEEHSEVVVRGRVRLPRGDRAEEKHGADATQEAQRKDRPAEHLVG